MVDPAEPSLLELEPGELGIVSRLEGGSSLQARFSSMGLHPGREVRKLPGAGLGGPVLVDFAGSRMAIGRGMARRVRVKVRELTMLLAGNPNVGKSVVFSRLTGLDTVSSNYPGTTVEYREGKTRMAGERFRVVDIPGAYSLSPSCSAEEVACRLLSESSARITILVADATNLERNLFFALQAIGTGAPIILLLNKWDTAHMKGIAIDVCTLSQRLGVPVVPFVAVTGEGLRELERAVADVLRTQVFRASPVPADDAGKWALIGDICRSVQRVSHKHPTFVEKLADLSVNPLTGLPLALVALAGAFWMVRLLGEGLLGRALDWTFRSLYLPTLLHAADAFLAPGFWRDMLIGRGTDPLSSFGILTTGLYIPLVAVLPYLAAFYLVLGYIEDLGYLPRLAVLLDGILHRLGLHGYGAIPLMLGLGCKVPALLAVRVLETRKERAIAMALVLFLTPCLPQSAMILALVGRYGALYATAALGTIMLAGLGAGVLLNRMLKGEMPEIFVEIPPYQLPAARVLLGKLWLRIREFLLEAVPMIVAGVALVGLSDAIGALKLAERVFGPALEIVLGLPSAAAPVVILGFLRKDVAISMLVPYSLSAGQWVVGSVFLALYLPCLASFSVLIREAGLKDAVAIALFGLVLALGAGGALHLAAGF
ncbi:MAG: FeoB small GTPase domain-containing protein [Elusimicrobia bacterium]|nr:FeoB small GTPase domain-containing protein [Elusimicrobiota bacterium]